MIKSKEDIDKLYLYAKDPYEAKYQYLINKREKVGLKHYDDPKMMMIVFTKILKNIIQEKKCKVLIVLDDMIANMINNKK